jgi:hypothetical protein
MGGGGWRPEPGAGGGEVEQSVAWQEHRLGPWVASRLAGWGDAMGIRAEAGKAEGGSG